MKYKCTKKQEEQIFNYYFNRYGTFPTEEEMRQEIEVAGSLNKVDWEDYNRQSDRYDKECGEVTTRKATPEEMKKVGRAFD